MATLRDWLRSEQQRRGLSGRAIAAETGIGLGAVQAILRLDDCRPKEETLQKLARWANIPFDTLYQLTYSQPRQTGIRQLYSISESRIHARIDTARAKIPAATCQWLDRLLAEQRADLEEQLGAYESLAAIYDRGNDDGAPASGGSGRHRDDSNPYEHCDVPLK